jgi:hypothetical protein
MEAFLTAQFLANFHAFVIIITPPQKSSRAGCGMSWGLLPKLFYTHGHTLLPF